jgi:hypothetical protein
MIRGMTQPAAASRPSSHEVRDLFLRLWAKELPTTRKVLERIPEGSDYRPDPKSRTAREIAWLIVREQIALVDGLERGEIRWTEPPCPATIADVLALDGQHRARMVERLQELPKGRTSWTDEETRKNFEAASRMVLAGVPAKSRLLTMPLAKLDLLVGYAVAFVRPGRDLPGNASDEQVAVRCEDNAVSAAQKGNVELEGTTHDSQRYVNAMGPRGVIGIMTPGPNVNVEKPAGKNWARLRPRIFPSRVNKKQNFLVTPI